MLASDNNTAIVVVVFGDGDGDGGRVDDASTTHNGGR